MNVALQKAEKIKSVFLDTQLFYATHNNMVALTAYLENAEREFSSIGYESASMAIAIKSFEANNFPGDWLLFTNGPGLAHQAQVYVGLGWAIAKLNIPFLTAVKKISTRFYFRIADGCGYYDGSFRNRRTVINGELPVYLPAEALPMYDQGIGRSIWYSEKADINKIAVKIETFAAGRHADLWRGVGIAVAYVGGCTDEELKKLLQLAETNRFQLACGAALAAKSRMMANTMTNDTDRCTRLWLGLTTGESYLDNSDGGDIYQKRILQIEEELSNSFEKVF